MRLNIPFFKQTTSLNCGPVALKMVLGYFGKEYETEVLERSVGIEDGKGVSTIQIALAAALLGYKTELYSRHILFNEENKDLEYYKRYGSMNLERSRELVEKARKAGVKIEEKTFDLEELLSMLNENSVAIVLIDWNIVMNRKEEGYQGHFVPIVGYDDKKVYVHNHGLTDTKEFMQTKREIFDEARKAKGTDEDIMIVNRN